MTLSAPNLAPKKSRLIGQIFGDRYLIQSLLSQKAGRQTFIAQDTQNNRTVIIKLLLFGVDFAWDDLKLFEREAAVLKSLDHPAIPKYLDYFDVETELGKGFALVQTHIAAKSLQEWVQSGRTFDEEQLKSIARHLLEILDYLHHRQPAVIHRDIKPSNILLGDRSGHSLGQIYLVDFGSVQTAVNTSNTMTIVGTYGYMPPEQFGGQTSPTSDLYSLGATLIYLATGQHPAEFPQKEMQILFEQQVNLSPSLTAWLRRLTKPCIEKRFETVKEASAALANPQSLTSTNGILSKPVGSKIQLHLTTDNLVLIAPYGVSRRDIVQYSGTLLLPLIIAGQFGGVMLWLAPAIISAFILGMIASARSGRIQLRITPQKIMLCYQILGLTYYWQSVMAKSADISKIELICEHHGYLPRQQGQMVKIPAQINIWTGIHRFELGKNLSQPELAWLVQELSIWLDLPVTRENSTLNRAAPYTGPSWRQ